jgi:hypothetical protein
VARVFSSILSVLRVKGLDSRHLMHLVLLKIRRMKRIIRIVTAKGLGSCLASKVGGGVYSGGE